VNGKPHEHSFVKQHHTRTANLGMTRECIDLESGIKDLVILKTTQSGFTKFHKCQYTVLPEVEDRMFGTAVNCVWKYTNEARKGEYKGVDFNKVFVGVVDAICEVFATTYSVSVQSTVYLAAEKVMERVGEVELMRFMLPNIHNLPFDFGRFGMPKNDTVFIAIDEPHGVISATIGRHKL